jgi:hypothetical protein
MLRIFDGSIFFIDQKFCWVFQFDSDGGFISRNLGQGRSPKEISTSGIDGFLHLADGKNIFIGPSRDAYIFDKIWHKVNQFSINLNEIRPDKELMSNPSPDDISIYTFDYEKFILRSDSKGNVFIPIYSELRNFNGFQSFDYYRSARILAKLDIEKRTITGLYGRRSPEYLKYRFIGHHAFFSYDIDDEGNFYICHEIDSLIYVYNPHFEFKYSFGISGHNMDTDYQQISEFDIKKIRELYFVDRPKRGYYNEIEKFDDYDILFRSYTRKELSPKDGLQIYKNEILVADIEVPKGFSVFGLIDDYFYAHTSIDEENELIKIYKFKFPAELMNPE